jgi:hypothetical protein
VEFEPGLTIAVQYSVREIAMDCLFYDFQDPVAERNEASALALIRGGLHILPTGMIFCAGLIFEYSQ